MSSQIYWIEPFSQARLGTMARPRGGNSLEDEVLAWKQAGVSIVVSGLTDSEMRELKLKKQAELCREHGIQFKRFPIGNHGLPSSVEDWLQFISELRNSLTPETALVAHCYMGIGRASLIAASLMVAAGIEPDRAFLWISEARGITIPDSSEQRIWVVDCASALQKAGRPTS